MAVELTLTPQLYAVELLIGPSLAIFKVIINWATFGFLKTVCKKNTIK